MLTKRIINLVLSLILGLNLVGCNSNQDTTTEKEKTLQELQPNLDEVDEAYKFMEPHIQYILNENSFVKFEIDGDDLSIIFPTTKESLEELIQTSQFDTMIKNYEGISSKHKKQLEDEGFNVNFKIVFLNVNDMNDIYIIITNGELTANIFVGEEDKIKSKVQQPTKEKKITDSRFTYDGICMKCDKKTMVTPDTNMCPNCVEYGQCYDCGEYKLIKNMVDNGRSYHCGCSNEYCEDCKKEIPYGEEIIMGDNCYVCQSCYENYIKEEYCPECDAVRPIQHDCWDAYAYCNHCDCELNEGEVYYLDSQTVCKDCYNAYILYGAEEKDYTCPDCGYHGPCGTLCDCDI